MYVLPLNIKKLFLAGLIIIAGGGGPKNYWLLRQCEGLQTNVDGELKIGVDNTQNQDRSTVRNRQRGCCKEDGLGSIYASMILGISRNPSLKDELKKAAIIGSGAVLADEVQFTAEEGIAFASEYQVLDNIFPSNVSFDFPPSSDVFRRRGCCPEDGVGAVWSALILGISRNPSLKDELQNIAIIGSGAVLAGDDVDQVAEQAAALSSEIADIEAILYSDP